jgi:DtxR family Mn-dependent transcriptional regulator
MAATKKLSASLEDYLEAIYQVIAAKQVARAKDLSHRLDVAPSSVTNALRGLVERGLINHAPYEAITLTPAGETLAKAVVHRHEVLTEFFADVLSVGSSEAAECACRMEHAISDTVLERLIAFINYEKRCNHSGATWVDGRGFICDSNSKNPAMCKTCSDQGFCSALDTDSSGHEEAHA